MKYAHAKRAKILFFIVKYANLWGFYCRRCRGCLSSPLQKQKVRFSDDVLASVAGHRVCLSSLIKVLGLQVVVRNMVSANYWLRSIETYMFLW